MGGSDSGGGVTVVASGARCCRYFWYCFSGCRKDTSASTIMIYQHRLNKDRASGTQHNDTRLPPRSE